MLGLLLSMPMTVCPSSKRALLRKAPMKPAAPVTRIVLDILLVSTYLYVFIWVVSLVTVEYIIVFGTLGSEIYVWPSKLVGGDG